MRAIILTLVTALAVLHAPCAAQSGIRHSQLAGAIDEAITKSYYVRITAGYVLEGRITMRPDSNVHIGKRSVPLSEVTQIEYRTVTSSGISEGALIGALIGGGAVFFLAAQVGGDMSGISLISMAGLGVGGGAMLGAMFGSSATRAEEWNVLWRR